LIDYLMGCWFTFWCAGNTDL